VATSISLAAPDGGKQLDAHTGDRIPLLVTVKDASDDKIPPPSPLTFISRNTTVAQVDSTGVVTTINPGLTYVVVEMPARGATLADSIPVTIALVLDRATRVGGDQPKWDDERRLDIVRRRRSRTIR
jgi:hypothetical protein